MVIRIRIRGMYGMFDSKGKKEGEVLTCIP